MSDTSFMVGLFVASPSELMYYFGTMMQCPSSTKPIWRIRLMQPAPNSLCVYGLASEAYAFWSYKPISIYRAGRKSCLAISKAFLLRAATCITRCLGSKNASLPELLQKFATITGQVQIS